MTIEGIPSGTGERAGHHRRPLSFHWAIEPDGTLNLAFFEPRPGDDDAHLFTAHITQAACSELANAVRACQAHRPAAPLIPCHTADRPPVARASEGA